jgi:hypothetical protein|nr:MAG TPA: hypothetical protein [Caudoviricetes sp.]
MGIPLGKIASAFGFTVERLTYAINPDQWDSQILADFASQYGSPRQYTIIERAKLIGTFGATARLLDIIQQSTLAPYSGKGRKPKSVLPENRKNTKKEDYELDSMNTEDINKALGLHRKEQ